MYEYEKERGRESRHYTYVRELRHSHKVLYLKWRHDEVKALAMILPTRWRIT